MFYGCSYRFTCPAITVGTVILRALDRVRETSREGRGCFTVVFLVANQENFVMVLTSLITRTLMVGAAVALSTAPDVHRVGNRLVDRLTGRPVTLKGIAMMSGEYVLIRHCNLQRDPFSLSTPSPLVFKVGGERIGCALPAIVSVAGPRAAHDFREHKL